MPKSQTQLNTEVFLGLYTQLKNGIINDEAVKAQIKFLDRHVYSKQLEKVRDNFPEVTAWDEFVEFLTHFGALKEGGTKSSGGGQKSLASIESAKEKGIPEEKIPEFITKMNALYAAKKEVDALLDFPYPNVALSIPKREKKVAKESTGEVAGT